MTQIFFSAGEASGDHYGALLIQALARSLPETKFFGLGGTEMESAGLDRVVRAEDVAHMGITEVIRHMPRVYSSFRRLKQSIRDRRPDLAVLIDFPDVNFRLAHALHDQGVPVLYFVSPQIWAWKKRRIRWVQRWVTRILVIFPFEEAYYRERGVEAEFVGHPLADLPLPAISREDFAQRHGLDPSKKWIALLPGSRPGEVRLNAPTLFAAAAEIASTKTGTYAFEFLVPVAPTLPSSAIDRMKREQSELVSTHSSSAQPPLIRFVDDAAAALFHAQASVVASGTATVLAARIGNPFIIVYRVSPITYAIAKRVVDVPHIGMVNLIAGRRVVPELIQSDFTASNVVRHLMPLLTDGPESDEMKQNLREVQAKLAVELPSSTLQHENRYEAENSNQDRNKCRKKVGAIERAAQAAIAMLPATHHH